MMLAAINATIGGALDLFVRMSPYLLFGLLFAGLLHLFVPIEWVARHLGRSNISSVVKAVAFGIPLPLCSCGVIPAAVLLRKKGASRGAVLSFLIATPISGIDSIMATYSLLGWFFTIYRIIASSVAALVAGLATNLFSGKETADKAIEKDGAAKPSCCHCDDHSQQTTEAEIATGHQHRRFWLNELLHYAFIEVMGELWKTLLIGIIIGAVITTVVPDSLIQNYMGSPWLSMLIMLAIGIPMYICATGSIPIAAALILKGLSPGAALVFLLSGPATNAVTIAFVMRDLGKRAVVIYLLSISIVCLLAGWLLNLFFFDIAVKEAAEHVHSAMLPRWLELASAIALAAIMAWNMVRDFKKR